MSGHRAIFKNDNFYLATNKESEQKEQQQLQKIKNHQKTDAYGKKVKAIQEKQDQNRRKVQKQDEEIFQKHFNQTYDDHAFSKTKKQTSANPEADEYAQLKKMMQQLKEKKASKKQTKTKDLPKIQEEKPCATQNQKKQSLQSTNTKSHKNTSKSDDDDNFDDLLEALKTNNVRELQNQEKKTSINALQSMFKPKSTLKPVQVNNAVNDDKIKHKQKQKTEVQLEWERKRQDKKMKQDLQKLEKSSLKMKEIQEGEKKECNKEKKDNEDQNGKKSKKKFKKTNNYQKLDLKRKYTDRFVGGIRENKRKYMKNGALKPKYRAVSSQLQIQNGQVYNTYIHSLSRSFHVQINLDSESDSEAEHERNIEIPTLEECSEERLTELIQQMFGFEKFRQGQYEVINNILNHQSTIFVSETASGKSLTYIISSLIMNQQEGMSIVISPLIALMLDQLDHLPVELPAACISSLINCEQRVKILQLVKNNEVKLLFMTPQMLNTDILFHLKQFPPISFVCIDEAHCLSELSQNFRTSYIALSQIIKNHITYNTPDSSPNILCLTATANTETIDSLSKNLQINKVIKSSSTLNKNLYITITRQVGDENKYRALVNYLNTKEIRKCEAVLIYCRSKYLIDRVFNFLTNSNIPVTVFHGALKNKDKTKIITDFKNKSIRVIISTTALGMGLDFQHLDCIVHFNMPKSLQSFVQETGRAGRRQKRAYCHLFLDKNDFFAERSYILADELEDDSMKVIVDEIEKSQNKVNCKTIKHVQKKTKTKTKKEDQKEVIMERVIQKPSLAIQKLQTEAQNSEQFSDMFQNSEDKKQNEVKQDSIIIEEQKFSPLYYIRTKELAQKTYLSQQSLLIILMKLAELINTEFSKNSNEQIIRILPLSNEFLKLAFSKLNQQQLVESQSHGKFYKSLVGMKDNISMKADCKKVNGFYLIPLISKCNQLKMTPIQLMSKVYEITNEYELKVQFINEVFLFSIKDGEKFKQNTKKQVILKLLNKVFQKDVMNIVNEVQNTSMIKLEVFYSLAFNYAQLTVSNLIEKGLIIDRSANIPSDNIMNEITKYFNTDINSFYNYIAQTEDQVEREMYLPTEIVDVSQYNKVYQCVKLFFKHQYSNLRDNNSKKQISKRKEAIIDEYKNGKIITRVFLGVNEQKSSRFIYGEHTYWKIFQSKKYFSLLKAVRQVIIEGRQDLINS